MCVNNGRHLPIQVMANRYHDHERYGNDDSLCTTNVDPTCISLNSLCIIGSTLNLRTNERKNTKRNEINERMSQDNTVVTGDANVVSTMSMESHDIPSVANIPGVAVPKPKKSKRASQ